MYSCEVCEAKFQSISGFNKHMRIKHKDLKKTKVIKRNLYTCNDCNETFDLKKVLIQHVKSHLMKNVQRQSLCSLCPKFFSSMSGLIVHLQSIHNVNIETKLLHFENIEGKLIYYYTVGVVCMCSDSVNTIIAGKYRTW